MNGNEIRFREQLRQLGFPARFLELPLLDEGVGVEHAHTEGRRPHGNLPRNVAEADQAERAAVQAEQGLAGGHSPRSCADEAVVERDLARAREQQRHRMLGHFLYAVGRVVGDDDARLRGRFQIYRIHADAVAGDDPALRHPRHDIGRDGTGVGVEQRVAIRSLGQELFGLFRLQGHQLGEALERFSLHVQGFPDVVGKHYFCFFGHLVIPQKRDP